MQNMRSLFLPACLAAGLFLLGAGCGKKEPVAATLNEKKIYVSEIEDMIQRYVAISRKMNPAYTEPAGQKLEAMRKDFLNGLIDKAVILDKAQSLNVSVSDEELKGKIDELKKANGILDSVAFSAYLKEQGISGDTFKKNIREIMVMEKTRDKFFLDITVTDAERKAFYDNHTERYVLETIRAAHILLKAPDSMVKDSQKEMTRLEARAKTVVTQARAGKDFKTLAKQYSDDPGTKGSGGDIGQVERGSMLPELDQALFALKKGQVSDPVRTQYGIHVLKALDDARRDIRKYDDVAADIAQVLVAEKRKARFQTLRDNVKVTVLWDYKTVQK
ncbi:MAG: peptidylprolyl isomerase [Fibrobacterota bacterium]